MSDAAAFLAKVASALDRAGVPYMLAGSFASSHHGAPRTTQDIDIVVSPSFDTLEVFLREMHTESIYLDADVARDEFKRRGQFNIIDGATAWKVDIKLPAQIDLTRQPSECLSRVIRDLSIDAFAGSLPGGDPCEKSW